jgi:MoxR-like ATPase
MKSLLDQTLAQINSVILGKEQVVRLTLCCILARGHLLIEDVPGVGKTTLAQALAKSLGLTMRRVQFTSDLLPADIIGNSIFDRSEQKFVFHAGPIFAQMVLADEVNRASPKAQSALLEAMEERQVTIDGTTHPLPAPFFVIATQNPLNQVGTYPLPESQLDRFLMRLELGFPDRDAERGMLMGGDRHDQVKDLKPVLTIEHLLHWQQHAREIHVSEPIINYVLDLLEASRRNQPAGGGLSPRAGMALQRCAQAWALMEGRQMVYPEDVQAVASAVMAHRLGGFGSDGSSDGATIAERLIKSVPAR